MLYIYIHLYYLKLYIYILYSYLTTNGVRTFIGLIIAVTDITKYIKNTNVNGFNRYHFYYFDKLFIKLIKDNNIIKYSLNYLNY